MNQVNVGKGQAKLLKPVAKAHCEEISADNYVDAFLDLVANNYDFTEIEGIGSVTVEARILQTSSISTMVDMSRSSRESLIARRCSNSIRD